MKTSLIFVLILIFIRISSQNAYSSINCQTNHFEHQFILEANKIAFKNDIINKQFAKKNEKKSREISSENGENIHFIPIKVRPGHSGIERTLYLNNNHYQIHLKDIDQFDDKNDFLVITNPLGHSMTYPLSCQRI
jgi:hypothetical protein